MAIVLRGTLVGFATLHSTRTRSAIVTSINGYALEYCGGFWKLLAEDLRKRDKLDLSERFVDATFVSAENGALPSA
jgi:hypothetical protein